MPQSPTTQNIFPSPLARKEQVKKERREKNVRKSYAYLTFTAALLGVYSFLFLYPQAVAYLNAENNIRDLEKESQQYDVILSDLGKTRTVHKAAYDETFKEEQAIISQVFPESPDKLEVIRLLENFATHLANNYPPFEFTSITFQDPRKENGYTVLPMQTTIHSSQDNFDRFLGLIHVSGDISPESPDHIRLMGISNISLRYRGLDQTGKDQGVDFTVSLNNYSQ